MSRGLWFAAGAGAGVYALTRARRAAEAFTADGLRDRLHALDVGVRMFAEEVSAGRRESEPELRRRLGVAPPDGTGPAAIDADARRRARPALAAAAPATDDQHEEGSQ